MHQTIRKPPNSSFQIQVNFKTPRKKKSGFRFLELQNLIKLIAEIKFKLVDVRLITGYSSILNNTFGELSTDQR